MRILLSGLLLLSFASATQAQDVLKCKFSIKSNKTKRNLKELRQSSVERTVELVAGQEHSEELEINRVIAYPGEKKTDKYLIRVFAEDKREEKLSEEKDIEMVRMDAKERVKFNVTHDGTNTIAVFKSNRSTYTLRIRGLGGTAEKSFPLYSHHNYLKKNKRYSRLDPIIINCKMVPEESILEENIKTYGNDALDEEARIKAGNGARSE